MHGSAPDIAGKNLANPTAVIRSAQLMLRHLGEHHAADKIHDGLEKVYRTKDKLTRDVGGKAGTSSLPTPLFSSWKPARMFLLRLNRHTLRSTKATVRHTRSRRTSTIPFLVAAIAFCATAQSQNLKVTLLGTGYPRPVMERFGPEYPDRSRKRKIVI